MPLVGSFAGASARAYGLGAGLPIVGDFESIQTITAGSAVASIEFTSIPATYTHLQIRWIARTNRVTYSVEDFAFQMNGRTTTAYYTNNALTCDGANPSVDFYGNTSGILGYLLGVASTSAANTNVFGVGITDILDYRNTDKYKTLITLTGMENNSATTNLTGAANFHSGGFLDTTAISSIKIAPKNGNSLTQYSSFALYGINA